MPLAGEVDLHEGREDGQRLARPVDLLPVERQETVCRARRAPLRSEVPREHLPGHARYRERRHGAAHVTIGVTILEPPHEHGVDRGAGHDAELAQPGHGAGEAPVGHGDAHAALDDPGQ